MFWCSEALEGYPCRSLLIFNEHICITWAYFLFYYCTPQSLTYILTYRAPLTLIAEDIAFLDHFSSLYLSRQGWLYVHVYFCACLHECVIFTFCELTLQHLCLLVLYFFLLLPLVSLAPSISHSLSTPTCLLSLCFLNLCVLSACLPFFLFPLAHYTILSWIWG